MLPALILRGINCCVALRSSFLFSIEHSLFQIRSSLQQCFTNILFGNYHKRKFAFLFHQCILSESIYYNEDISSSYKSASVFSVYIPFSILKNQNCNYVLLL